jgi:transporter family protein
MTTGFSWIFYYKALKLGNVSYVATIDKGSIVVAIVLSYFLLKEPITPKLLVGGGLVLAGLLVMVFWD